MSTGKSSREKSDGGILGSRPRLVNLFTTYLLEKSIVGTYPWKFDLCLDILDYLQTALVVLLRHPPHSQPRPSFIACFNPLLGTFSERGGSTVVINLCVLWVGFQLLLLLFNQIQRDDLSAAWPSFLTFLTAILLCLHPTPSVFSNICLYNLPGILYI